MGGHCALGQGLGDKFSPEKGEVPEVPGSVALLPRAELLIVSSGGSARLPLTAVGRGEGLADPAVLTRVRDDAQGWLAGCSARRLRAGAPGLKSWKTELGAEPAGAARGTG